MSDSLRDRYKNSPFFGDNADFIEGLYEAFLADPDSVDSYWRDYFTGFQHGAGGSADQAHQPVRDEMRTRARTRRVAAAPDGGMPAAAAEKQAAVLRLINLYRVRGHQHATLDPLDWSTRPHVPDLDPEFHGLTGADMDTVFNTGTLVGPDRLPLREIVARLQRIYCGTIGAEYMYIMETDQKRWIQERLEDPQVSVTLPRDERVVVMKQLTAAEGIEKYLHTRYVGQKRFSLEGGESLIPLLDEMIQRGGADGIEEMVIGMAHRGRLNVLVNVFGKKPTDLFNEFEGIYDPQVQEGSGDVKYHLGFSSNYDTPSGKTVHLVLAFNPSHLEIVNPVVQGSVRARQHRRRDQEGSRVLPVLIHGDAAFAGQGVVMECLQMSQARGFHIGGTLHIVINNQIGFTTSNPLDARSTMYATDVAKMVEAPVFHVNGDDADAVVFVTRLALDYRMKFRKDVVIDMVCYRRHGHNEADEPAATQPDMYARIRKHPTTRQIFADKLVADGVIEDGDPQRLSDEYRATVEEGTGLAHARMGTGGNEHAVDWTVFNKGDWTDPADTTVPLDRIRAANERLTTLPEDFVVHPRVERVVEDRRKMGDGKLPMDWGFAETLAYATLLEDGFAVRLVGQDSGRGTFFHRHAVLHNQADASAYVPLQQFDEGRADFQVIDSLLSEEAVVGFEYGYSTAEPNALVIWEGQFGDFANGAQVVIDQFISSGELKWRRMCGLVMFLPHGYEGQGPEHSSARLERYLQLCAEHNMQVCQPTTPAQMYHMLRRQMVRQFRKPLIVMTPKSLLRHRLSTSPLEDLQDGRFHNVIPEVDDIDPKKVSRLVVCSGKVYFDLLEARRAQEIDEIAIVRIEQLYPFPQDEYAEQVAKYANADDIIWCQDEPENQGPWYQIRHRLQEPLESRHTLTYVGRAASASTAAGYHALHVAQQKQLLEAALNGTRRSAGNKTRKPPAKKRKKA
ncbi:MAG: 2-oxoglutarate dehydrogenase E1 component [Xanthomonadaceae bacterium]|nr:2-oxoglutarate dehydrogenase E1 component [Xanthomonadaceae bacterium]